MSYVAIKGISQLDAVMPALCRTERLNTNDTYIVALATRGDHSRAGWNVALTELQKRFCVKILLDDTSANNYYVHIGDFTAEDSLKDAQCLSTIIFELEPLINEVKVPTMPEVSG